MPTIEPVFFGTYKSRAQGIRGQAITLPTPFCKSNDIRPTDELDIYIIDGDEPMLIIKPHRKKKEVKP